MRLLVGNSKEGDAWLSHAKLLFFPNLSFKVTVSIISLLICTSLSFEKLARVKHKMVFFGPHHGRPDVARAAREVWRSG